MYTSHVIVIHVHNIMTAPHISDCFKLLDELLSYCSSGLLPKFMSPAIQMSPPAFLPERNEGNVI